MKLSQIQPNLWGHPSRVFGVQFWLSQAVGLAGGPEAGAGREAGAALGAQILQTEEGWDLRAGVTPQSPEAAPCPLSCDEISVSDN